MTPRFLFVLFAAAAIAGCSSGNGGDGDGDGDRDDDASSGPGDFTSVWRADTVEILIQDTENPTGLPSNKTYDVPTTLLDANVGAEVESFIAFDATHLIRYAHYEGTDSYYRITQPGTLAEDVFVASTSNFLLEDGELSQTSIAQDGTQLLIITTHFEVAQFPPSNWPSAVITYDAEAGQ